MSDLLALIFQIALPVLGSGGIVTYAIHKMQHRIALLQQDLETQRLQFDKRQADRDYALQSLKEVLAVREQELTRLRAELQACQDGLGHVSDLKAQLHVAGYAHTALRQRVAAQQAVIEEQERKMAALTTLVQTLRKKNEGQERLIWEMTQTDQRAARLHYYQQLARDDKDSTKELPPPPERLNGPDTSD